MDTVTVETSELIGSALDWAVAKCEGWGVSVEEFLRSQMANSKFSYSTVWAKGGPIIEREEIGFAKYGPNGTWKAVIGETPRGIPCYGPTPLIAAMRCYVASKLGDTVQIPKELVP